MSIVAAIDPGLTSAALAIFDAESKKLISGLVFAGPGTGVTIGELAGLYVKDAVRGGGEEVSLTVLEEQAPSEDGISKMYMLGAFSATVGCPNVLRVDYQSWSGGRTPGNVFRWIKKELSAREKEAVFFGKGTCHECASWNLSHGVCGSPRCKSSQIFQAVGLGLYALGRYGKGSK